MVLIMAGSEMNCSGVDVFLHLFVIIVEFQNYRYFLEILDKNRQIYRDPRKKCQNGAIKGIRVASLLAGYI